MATLDKLIELNSLKKQNRRNRLEDKLRQQYYGDIEDLFDLLTNTLNTIVRNSMSYSKQNFSRARQ